MSYNDFRNRLDFLDTKVEITDIDTCRQYTALVNNKEQLPAGVTYISKYSSKGNQYYAFYRPATDEEIKTIIEISNAKSMKRTGDSLHFFKMLTIWSLIISLIITFFSLLAI